MSYQIRFTLLDGRTGRWMREYATREEAQQAIDDRMADTGPTYAVEEVVTREARFRELEAEVAHLRDAYDAARQDRDVAMRNVARLESTLGMVQASWAASVAAEDAARAITRQHRMEAEALHGWLDRALALGDAMHRAMTTAQAYLSGEWGGVNVALAEWAAYKEQLAASRQDNAKASEALKDAP